MTYHDRLPSEGVQVKNVTEHDNLLRVETKGSGWYWIPSTTANKYLFSKRIAEYFDDKDNEIVLEQSPYLAVKMYSFKDFRIWSGDEKEPIYVPVKYHGELMEALHEFRETGETSRFESVVSTIRSAQARPRIVNAVLNMQTDLSDIVPTSDGWIIDGLFFLKWNGKVYPYSKDSQSPNAWGEITDPSLFEFSLQREQHDGMVVSIENTEYDVLNSELLFLSISRWLQSYANKFYPEYWDNFERSLSRDLLDEDSSDNGSESMYLFDEDGPITKVTYTGENTPDLPITIPEEDCIAGDVKEIWETARELAEDNLEIEAYRCHTTRMPHRHKPAKHDLVEDIGVNPALVSEMLIFSPDDHAAVHELVARRNELVECEYDVFQNTTDNDENKWHRIEQKLQIAEINARSERILEEILNGLEVGYKRPKSNDDKKWELN